MKYRIRLVKDILGKPLEPKHLKTLFETDDEQKADEYINLMTCVASQKGTEDGTNKN